MAVNRVILQQFSMQLNYLNKERSNIYQPSAKTQQKLQRRYSIGSIDPVLLPNKIQSTRQFSSSDDDDLQYNYDKFSESSSHGSQPTSPSEQSSDEDIQTIMDNCVPVVEYSRGMMNNILKKCNDAMPFDVSPLQSRRRQQPQLYIVVPTPSG